AGGGSGLRNDRAGRRFAARREPPPDRRAAWRAAPAPYERRRGPAEGARPVPALALLRPAPRRRPVPPAPGPTGSGYRDRRAPEREQSGSSAWRRPAGQSRGKRSPALPDSGAHQAPVAPPVREGPFDGPLENPRHSI